MKIVSLLCVLMAASTLVQAQESLPVVTCHMSNWVAKDATGKILESKLFPAFDVVDQVSFSSQGFAVSAKIYEVCNTASPAHCSPNKLAVAITKGGATSESTTSIRQDRTRSVSHTALTINGETYQVSCLARLLPTEDK